MTAETGEPEREQRIANLDEVAALDPVVVADHKKVENDNDPKIIAESRQYLGGLLPDRRRGDHNGRHHHPDGRALPRLGKPAHALALSEDSRHSEGQSKSGGRPIAPSSATADGELTYMLDA
ncbi:hypothetical protein ABZ746_30570 [Streptomyces sp. NPDC020096]